MPSPIVSSPDPGRQRLVRRSRIVSYVLAGLGVVALSFAPSVLGEPASATGRVLLDVVRPVVAAALIVAALAVQVAVGVQWRRRLRQDVDTDPDDRVPPA